MRLPASAVALFYKLYSAVLLYTNHQLGLARQVTTLAQLRAMPEEASTSCGKPSMRIGNCWRPSCRRIPSASRRRN